MATVIAIGLTGCASMDHNPWNKVTDDELVEIARIPAPEAPACIPDEQSCGAPSDPNFESCISNRCSSKYEAWVEVHNSAVAEYRRRHKPSGIGGSPCEGPMSAWCQVEDNPTHLPGHDP